MLRLGTAETEATRNNVQHTPMLQEVLAQSHWQGRLTETDLRALTPVTWERVFRTAASSSTCRPDCR